MEKKIHVAATHLKKVLIKLNGFRTGYKESILKSLRSKYAHQSAKICLQK